jgi:hypothetical protein
VDLRNASLHVGDPHIFVPYSQRFTARLINQTETIPLSYESMDANKKASMTMLQNSDHDQALALSAELLLRPSNTHSY